MLTQAMRVEMDTVRGGPWPKQTWTSSMVSQIKDCASCLTLVEISELSTKYPTGSIAKHLANVSFKEDGKNSLAPILKTRRSGVAGNLCRKRQIQRGVRREGSDEHVRLQRGIDPVSSRRKETAKRAR